MRHLQPDRCQQNHIHCAERNLASQCDGKKGHPCGALLLSPERLKQPKNIVGMFDEKSCRTACRSESAGKMVSPRLASEPVIPMTMTDTRPTPAAII